MRLVPPTLYALLSFTFLGRLGQCVPGGCISCARPGWNGTDSDGISQFTDPSSRGVPPPPPDINSVSIRGYHDPLPNGLVGDRMGFLFVDLPGQSLTTNRFRISCGARNDELRAALFAAMQALAATLNDFAEPPYDFGFPVLFAASFRMQANALEQLSKVGAPVPVTDHHRKSTTREKPLLLCATPDMLKQYAYSTAYYDACRRQPYWPAYHAAGSNAIIICPSFWALAVTPQRSLCPAWDNVAQQWQTTANAETLNFRAYAILQQLIQMSITGPAPVNYSPPFAWINWNEQLSLPSTWKQHTPTNYLLYAALVHQRCPIRAKPESSWEGYLQQMGVTAQGHVQLGGSPRGRSTAQDLM